MIHSRPADLPFLDRAALVRMLVGFLEGEYSLADLEKRLPEYVAINFDWAPGLRRIQPEGINALTSILGDKQLPVTSRHVRGMLERYLRKETSEIELSNWAAFVCMSTLFGPEGDTDEEKWEAGEGPAWDILQRLT